MEADRDGGRLIRMKIMFVVSSPLYCSKCLTLHPLPHLFIPTSSRLLWEALSHAAVLGKTMAVYTIKTSAGNLSMFMSKTSAGNLSHEKLESS